MALESESSKVKPGLPGALRAANILEAHGWFLPIGFDVWLTQAPVDEILVPEFHVHGDRPNGDPVGEGHQHIALNGYQFVDEGFPSSPDGLHGLKRAHGIVVLRLGVRYIVHLAGACVNL